MTRIAVLGDGAMGTACSLILAKKPDHSVVLWSAFEDNARILREKRENVRLLPGVAIPESIELTTDIEQALAGADVLLFAIPTVYLRESLVRLGPSLWRGKQPAVSVAKGLERDTFLRPTQIMLELAGDRPVAVLSGPSHAEEISRGLPASLVAASTDSALATRVQELFGNDRFRVYTNADIIGVELAGALKNVIGIAAGISDGLGFGDNTKSALLTRALVEMTRFGVAHGAEPQTFTGLAGLGDLITTCISPHGRNRRVGMLLGQGRKLDEILAATPMVAEGVYTARSVHDEARKLGIDMPITREVYQVLYESKSPQRAVQDLMQREQKPE